MAPKGPNDDFEFIMTCLKYSDTKAKPDFNLVAREIGAKSASAAYHRHWGIMKKYGLAGGGIGRARQHGAVGLSADSSASAIKRRGRKSKAETVDVDNGKQSDNNETAATTSKDIIKEEEVNMEGKDIGAIARDRCIRKKKALPVKLEKEDLTDESE